jgi:hypothetical protein
MQMTGCPDFLMVSPSFFPFLHPYVSDSLSLSLSGCLHLFLLPSRSRLLTTFFLPNIQLFAASPSFSYSPSPPRLGSSYFPRDFLPSLSLSFP